MFSDFLNIILTLETFYWKLTQILFCHDITQQHKVVIHARFQISHQRARYASFNKRSPDCRIALILYRMRLEAYVATK